VRAVASTKLAMVDLPAADRPVNHKNSRTLSLELNSLRLAHNQILAVDIGRTPEPKKDHASGNC
jgi:hypothetical protein